MSLIQRLPLKLLRTDRFQETGTIDRDGLFLPLTVGFITRSFFDQVLLDSLESFQENRLGSSEDHKRVLISEKYSIPIKF